MNVTIINDEKYTWHYEKINNAKIYVKGLLWSEGKFFRETQACKKLAETFVINNTNRSLSSLPFAASFKKNILKLRGHFSFIIDSPDFVLAAVDRIRSYPIFYNEDNFLAISNSALRLQTEYDLYERDTISFLDVEMAGYVTGCDTLFKNLLQLQAGEFLVFNKGKTKLETVRYYRYWTDEIDNKPEEELIDELYETTIRTFSQMIETLDGRPVWIPLSGGLDSRLVLAMLHELKYDNISTFSYGVPGLWEIKQAKRIAEYLKIKWHFVPYEPKKIKKLFYTTERKDYFHFASGLSSIPFLSEFYSLWILRHDKVIPGDSVIINGQSGDYLTGGHVPKRIEKMERTELNVDSLLKAIINKHFSLWLNLKTKENIAIISEKILALLKLAPDSKFSASEFVRYFELYEWQERQSKYVVNGQRMYEWFGYDWKLPLWSDDLMSFWLKVDWKVKFNQKLYLTYLRKYDIGGVFAAKEPLKNPYVPLYIKCLNRIFSIIGKVTAIDSSLYVQKYSKYFMTYASYYPQRNYWEYLKDSQWHRNYISYLAKNFIENL